MPRFLVVDDSPTIRAALRAQLGRRHAAVVDEAATLDAALALAQAHKPDVAIVGMRLADDESTLPLQTRLLQLDPGLPILLCTVMPRDHPEVVEAMMQGAYGMLPKPVRGHDLEKMLNSIELDRGRLKRIQ